MSEPKLISPMLDNFIMGSPISDHHGVCCCPAMENETDGKFIVKVISVPATPSQMDALLLSGAFPDEASALAYFKDLTDGVVLEVNTQNRLAELEGFLPYNSYQVVPMESGKGYEVYLLSEYKCSLEKHFKRHAFTHLDALNLGLDLCAALSACRKSGYLYVDLKPSNVFVSDQQQYCIGDLGFLSLDSLKYASLPEKYLSAYTPPEINDAFSALNSTMDTYATGLILYQTYNNGVLPIEESKSSDGRFSAPAYADREMSEIILKACSPNPDERWQDPMQMGQAIISYMQRNGANDTPIVPIPQPEPNSTDENTVGIADSKDLKAADVPSEGSKVVDGIEFSEDEFGNLSFLADVLNEASALDEDPDYDAASDDVNGILSQVDELASLTVPQPVIVPEHVEVSMPELPKPPEPEEIEEQNPDVLDETAVGEETDKVDEPAETEQATEVNAAGPETVTDIEPAESYLPKPVKKEKHWLRNTILLIVLLAVLAGGYYGYKNYYLLPIESITVEGQEDSLTVFISTNADESLLRVFCADTYGNQMHASVVNGKAEFSGLVPNTTYNIKLVASGFHLLTGNTTAAFSSSIQSTIVQFDAITGITDGSVILSFTVDGPDSKEWTVLYTAEGEAERSATFSSHMVTLTDLSIGKEYTFRLIPGKELYITGQDTLVFTASKLIRAQNLEIVSCMDNALTVEWTAPEDEAVLGWSVHCVGSTYNQTITTKDTSVTFQGLDHNAAYSVEVKAIGMSVSQMVTIHANSVTATNIKIDTSDPTTLSLSWETSKSIPAEGWLLRYNVDGIDYDFTIPLNQNAVDISPIIPATTYSIQLEDVNGNTLLGSKMEITTGDPVPLL